MTTQLNVCIISGSTRTNSSSSIVARAAGDEYAALGVSATVVDLRQFPDDALSHKEIHEPPESFGTFARAALNADALVIVVPEYNGGMPGALKSFVDFLPLPGALHHRSVAFVGVAAGSWGGLRPIEQLTSVFMYRQAFVYPGHLFIRDCEDMLDLAAGTIVNPETRQRLSQQSNGFVRFASALRGLRS